jgi:predicted RND superfamily exporter protein
MKQLVTRMARASAQHPWFVLSLTLILSAFALQAASRLPVFTSRQALLPQNTEVAWRLNRFLEKFGAASDLVVALENAPRGDMEAYASELAKRLKAEPEIDQATERLDSHFFMQHAYLLMPQAQLARLDNLLSHAGIAKPANLESLLQNAHSLLSLPASMTEVDLNQANTGLKAIGAALDEWQRWIKTEPTARVDWSGLLTSVGAGQLGDGYFSSHDGKMLFLFVHASNHSEDFEVLQPFNERVKTVAATLAEEYRAAGRVAPGVVLTGLPAIEYEEYLDIEKDIKLVIWTAAGLIAALIFLVVRSVRWALAIFIPMGLGALWSLALALGTVGHLTIITSSFLAILFGLGADYGIFTTSQIAEERRKGKSLIDAIGDGMGGSFHAVMTAGGASLLIFGALATVDFPGFAELGLVAAGGVLLILLSTWVVQPAIYSLLPPNLKPPKDPDKQSSGIKGSYPRSLAVGLVLLAIVTAIAGLRAGTRIPFDYDVLSLLPVNSQAAQYQRRMVKETDYQSEVVIFTADTLDEIRRITDEASRLKSIAKVQSITNLFPTDANSRLDQAREIGLQATKPQLTRTLESLGVAGLSQAANQSLIKLLEKASERIDEAQEQAFSAGHADLVKGQEKIRSQIESLLESAKNDPKTTRTRTEAFLRALISEAHQGIGLMQGWREANPLTPADLPDTLRDRFVAPDGTLAAYAFPAKSVYDPANLEQLVTEVYSVSPDATGFPTTHLAFTKAVVDSFTRGTLLAAALCLLWLLLVLRNLRGFILASLPLVIGGGWMLGLMAISGLSYNYANIIALPLVIALAVDYGVWYSHRWTALREHSPLAVTWDAGKVIALAAGTELAGLGAITLASYRGVAGLGMDITLGLLSCLLATLLVAPAIGQLIDSKRRS